MKLFITGPTRGIGRAILDELTPELDEVWALVRESAQGEDIKRRLGDRCEVHPIVSDLERTEEVQAAVRAASINALDAAVLCAGVFTEGPLSDLDMSAFKRDLEINLISHAVLSSELVGSLSRGKAPRVVMIGSTAAYEPYPLVPSYGVAKYGLRGLAINLREELRERGIGVTLVSPGGTLTDMWEGEDLPPNRLLDPSDVGKLVRASLTLSPQAVVEDLIVRPILGDIHE
ncbi:MAG: SDR family NAD(P)-dependent oxidoreductase [Solirubrobacterales bacterium]|nr:SDR family NAD(P)-dependent oxidoreductase [Solirubrobacterales bacterium]